MFTVETSVGRKWGHWLRSDRTFPTAEAARFYADSISSAERRAGSSKVLGRRVVGL